MQKLTGKKNPPAVGSQRGKRRMSMESSYKIIIWGHLSSKEVII